MTFYGLVDYRLAGTALGEVIEIYSSREEAGNALRDVLADEPEWEGQLGVVVIDLGPTGAS
jgi:hypothetical protein